MVRDALFTEANVRGIQTDRFLGGTPLMLIMLLGIAEGSDKT